MSPSELSATILAIVGIFLQLTFKYFPKVSTWYQAQSNKGLLMLAFVLTTSGVYFFLSCTPYAAQFGIGITCTTDSLFVLLKAIGTIALSQQLTYLFTRST